MDPLETMPPARPNDVCAEVRSGLYLQFAQVLSNPDEAILDGLFSGERLSAMKSLATRLPYPTPFEGITTLIPDGISRQDVRVFYASHFEAGGRSISLRESGYSTLTEKALMEENFRYYQHFGLNLAGLAQDGIRELPDHLCVQLEFLHYLSYLEMRTSQAATATDNLGALRRAQGDFIAQHVGNWVNALALKLEQADSAGLYASLSLMLDRFIQLEGLYLADCEQALIATSGR